MIKSSSYVSKITKFSAFVNEEDFLVTLNAFIKKLEAQMGTNSYGCNYMTTTSGLKRVTVIFKEENK